jgi:hypothetical protein
LEGVRLAVHQALELPLILKAGGPDSQITVTANANRIEVNNSALKYRLTEKQIADLPILIGMNLFERIAFLVPGASNGNRFNLPLLSGLSINGSPAGGVAFSIDGIDNSSMGNFARLAVFAGGALSRGPNADAVQEFTAITANFKAETGARSAHLNLEIKSGENELRGQARSIYLNPALAARDFFDMRKKTGASTMLLGFQLSGPLVIPWLYRGQNRTHFFVDAQNTWSKDPRVGQVFTLSEAQREGGFQWAARRAMADRSPHRRRIPGGKDPHRAHPASVAVIRGAGYSAARPRQRDRRGMGGDDRKRSGDRTRGPSVRALRHPQRKCVWRAEPKRVTRFSFSSELGV